MNDIPRLIVMLTYDDLTVNNAYDIFDKCKHTKAQYWGFKEEPLPFGQMKKLFGYMKECGKTTVLEAVSYTEEKSLESAEIAVSCGCDILMGTMFYDSVSNLCRESNILYMPYVGNISGRPSVLTGSIDSIIASANDCLEKGVYGLNLLGYRYGRDGAELIKRFVSEVNAPVCIAGSVNSFQRLDELKDASPWAFTIGSGFFEHTFGESFGEQIDRVCGYMSENISKNISKEEVD